METLRTGLYLDSNREFQVSVLEESKIYKNYYFVASDPRKGRRISLIHGDELRTYHYLNELPDREWVDIAINSIPKVSV